MNDSSIPDVASPDDSAHVLPSRTIDLIRDGVRGRVDRRAVASAVMSVMLSARRHNVPMSDVWVWLSDERKSRLAKQISTGRRGKPFRPAARQKFLRDLWETAGAVIEAEDENEWTPQQALADARVYFDQRASRELTSTQFRVMRFLLEKAERTGTTRVSGPARVVGDGIGVGKDAAHRAMLQLCASGWLHLSERGRVGEFSKKANVYLVLPAVTHPRVAGHGYRPPRSARPRPQPIATHTGVLTQESRSPRMSRATYESRSTETVPTYESRSEVPSSPTYESRMPTYESPSRKSMVSAPAPATYESTPSRCPHGFTIVTPDEETPFGRGAHDGAGHTYTADCWGT